MRIAVLGAGAMGGVAARLLARHDDVDIVVVDADALRAEKVVAGVGRGEARAFDVTAGNLAGALAGTDAIASCLPYRLNLPVMEAALEAGCHYADLGGLFHVTLRQWDLDERFREAGVAAVMGIGSAPGITNLLAGIGAARLDRTVSVDMVDGTIEEEEGGFGIPYSAETILDEFTKPAMVFEAGELKEVPAGSGVIPWEFPEPLGTLQAMYTLHSEPATIPRNIPGVRDVRWRLALPAAVHDGFSFLTSIGLAGTEPVQTAGGPVVPRDVLVAVLSGLPAPEGEPRDIEYIDVRVAGEKDGHPAVFRGLARFVPPPEGFSAGAFGTALPIATAARWMSEGRVEPGVHAPETAFDGEAFAAELERDGVEFTFSVET